VAFVIGNFSRDPSGGSISIVSLLLNNNLVLFLQDLGLPLIFIYTMRVLEVSVWLDVPDRSIRGVPVNKARKLQCLFVISCYPLSLRPCDKSLMAVGIIGWLQLLTKAGLPTFHKASDMFPKKAVGSVVGLVLSRSIGGMIFLNFIRIYLEQPEVTWFFIIMARSAYLLH